MRLAGKTALITGATSGIGKATAILFAEEGARVAAVGRDGDRGRGVEEEIRSAGGQAIFVQADVRRADDCERAVGETVDAFGRLDVLFNNAGVYVANDVIGCSVEEWDAQVDTSLKGTFLMSKFALPHMVAQGSGSIVNCSSGWGLVGGERAAAYCAAKGGMVVMTKAMALDHGPQGIRVNAVCPSDTNRTYTSRIRFYQHPSLAWLVGEAQSEAVVKIGLLRWFSCLQDADEIAEALHHRPDVVLGERRRWTTSAEFHLGRPPLTLDLADPPGDDGGVGSGFERLPIAGKSGVAAGEHLSGGRCPVVVDDERLLSLGKRATRLFQPGRLEDPRDPVIERRDDLRLPNVHGHWMLSSSGEGVLGGVAAAVVGLFVVPASLHPAVT